LSGFLGEHGQRMRRSAAGHERTELIDQ
jgi:hypothetical protein